MEDQIIQFTEKITSHFTDKIKHTFSLSSDQIILDLFCEEAWEDFELQALHSICKKESKKFERMLEYSNFDTSFLISSIPSENRVRIKWYKHEL